MIDSVAIVWGTQTPVSAVDGGNRPHGGPLRRRARVAESAPVYLDWDELLERHGSTDGEVRRVQYGEREMRGGHWKPGDFELLYADGRVELRASLPKLLTGRNDAMLDQAGVHDALRELVRLGDEAAGVALDLRAAVPSRLDFCFGWEVPSVAWCLEHWKSSFRSRAMFDETKNPRGGHTISWGKRGKRMIRIYDKGAELTEQAVKAGEYSKARSRVNGKLQAHRFNCRCEQCGPSPFPIDTLLRFEIQERRRSPLRFVHERGYRADDVRHELQRTIHQLGNVALHDLRDLVETHSPETVGVFIRSQWLRENPAAWPILREGFPSSTYYRWRQQAAERVLGSAYWAPEIPDDAFDSGGSLWYGGDGPEKIMPCRVTTPTIRGAVRARDTAPTAAAAFGGSRTSRSARSVITASAVCNAAVSGQSDATSNSRRDQAAA